MRKKLLIAQHDNNPWSPNTQWAEARGTHGQGSSELHSKSLKRWQGTRENPYYHICNL